MSVRTTLPVCGPADALSAFVSAQDVAAILECLLVTASPPDVGDEVVVLLPVPPRGPATDQRAAGRGRPADGPDDPALFAAPDRRARLGVQRKKPAVKGKGLQASHPVARVRIALYMILASLSSAADVVRLCERFLFTGGAESTPEPTNPAYERAATAFQRLLDKTDPESQAGIAEYWLEQTEHKDVVRLDRLPDPFVDKADLLRRFAEGLNITDHVQSEELRQPIRFIRRIISGWKPTTAEEVFHCVGEHRSHPTLPACGVIQALLDLVPAEYAKQRDDVVNVGKAGNLPMLTTNINELNALMVAYRTGTPARPPTPSAAAAGASTGSPRAGASPATLVASRPVSPVATLVASRPVSPAATTIAPRPASPAPPAASPVDYVAAVLDGSSPQLAPPARPASPAARAQSPRSASPAPPAASQMSLQQLVSASKWILYHTLANLTDGQNRLLTLTQVFSDAKRPAPAGGWSAEVTDALRIADELLPLQELGIKLDVFNRLQDLPEVRDLYAHIVAQPAYVPPAPTTDLLAAMRDFLRLQLNNTYDPKTTYIRYANGLLGLIESERLPTVVAIKQASGVPQNQRSIDRIAAAALVLVGMKHPTHALAVEMHMLSGNKAGVESVLQKLTEGVGAGGAMSGGPRPPSPKSPAPSPLPVAPAYVTENHVNAAKCILYYTLEVLNSDRDRIVALEGFGDTKRQNPRVDSGPNVSTAIRVFNALDPTNIHDDVQRWWQSLPEYAHIRRMISIPSFEPPVTADFYASVIQSLGIKLPGDYKPRYSYIQHMYMLISKMTPGALKEALGPTSGISMPVNTRMAYANVKALLIAISIRHPQEAAEVENHLLASRKDDARTVLENLLRRLSAVAPSGVASSGSAVAPAVQPPAHVLGNAIPGPRPVSPRNGTRSPAHAAAPPQAPRSAPLSPRSVPGSPVHTAAPPQAPRSASPSPRSVPGSPALLRGNAIPASPRSGHGQPASLAAGRTRTPSPVGSGGGTPQRRMSDASGGSEEFERDPSAVPSRRSSIRSDNGAGAIDGTRSRRSSTASAADDADDMNLDEEWPPAVASRRSSTASAAAHAGARTMDEEPPSARRSPSLFRPVAPGRTSPVRASIPAQRAGPQSPTSPSIERRPSHLARASGPPPPSTTLDRYLLDLDRRRAEDARAAGHPAPGPMRPVRKAGPDAAAPWAAAPLEAGGTPMETHSAVVRDPHTGAYRVASGPLPEPRPEPELDGAYPAVPAPGGAYYRPPSPAAPAGAHGRRAAGVCPFVAEWVRTVCANADAHRFELRVTDAADFYVCALVAAMVLKALYGRSVVLTLVDPDHRPVGVSRGHAWREFAQRHGRVNARMVVRHASRMAALAAAE